MSLTQDKIRSIVESSFLRANHVFERPPVCLEIYGEYGKQIFATFGNFSTMLAPAKAGKTTATALIIIPLITRKPFLNFIPSLPDNKRIIAWIDTEQGNFECIKTIQIISHHVTGDKTKHPENLKFLSLRKYDKEVRLSVIEWIIENTENLGFLVIDGIRDLVSSINDEKEATNISQKLLKWTQEKNIHILVVIHQNKGNEDARGHLGSELINKAETVVNLKRDDLNGKRTTTMEAKYTRHKEFESFAFTIDDNGSATLTAVKTEYEPKNPKADQLTLNQIETLLNAVFYTDKKLTYKSLYESIQLNLKKSLQIEFGIDKAKKLRIWLQNQGYIHYDETSKHYSSNIPLSK